MTFWKPCILSTDQRRAIELLADCPDGCTEPLMIACGFTHEVLAELILLQLVIAETVGMIAGRKQVRLLKITPTGRSELER